MTKRFFSALLAALMLAVTLTTAAFAVDESKSFDFALSVDGKTERQAVTGDVITVTFTLRRTDADEPYPLYAMQNEILYDGTFFELMPGSGIANNSIRTTDITLRDGYHAFYMNRASFNVEGETWQANTMVGTFQLKVIGTAGSSVIRSSNNFVSTKGGEDRYAATAQDVTVTVSEGCRIRFESNGGSEVPDQTVALGGKITKPADPTKDGLYFAGWYSDIDLQNQWDFGKDTVTGNMTLYAKWTDEAPTHSFNWLWVILAVLVLLVVTLVVLGRKNGLRRGNSGVARSNKKKEDNEQ